MDLRPKEFKLRQRNSSIPKEMQSKVADLLNQGISKKALCIIFGCSYEELKKVKQQG